jgi:hypothetical protein
VPSERLQEICWVVNSEKGVPSASDRCFGLPTDSFGFRTYQKAIMARTLQLPLFSTAVKRITSSSFPRWLLELVWTSRVSVALIDAPVIFVDHSSRREREEFLCRFKGHVLGQAIERPEQKCVKRFSGVHVRIQLAKERAERMLNRAGLRELQGSDGSSAGKERVREQLVVRMNLV